MSLRFALAALAATCVGVALADDKKKPATTAGTDDKPPATLGNIDRKDPALDAIIPKDAKIEIIATGFKWSEGTIWDKKKNRLLFSDIPNNMVYEWSQSGGLKEFLKPSGYTGTAKFEGHEPGSNGLQFDAHGNLVLCQHGDRRISRLENGKFVTLADKFTGKRLNSPNDLVFAANGDLYFTDPPYGLPKIMEDPAKELDFQGVYRLKPNGELTLATKEMSRPNGIALSPDGKTLYVANSDPDLAIWKAFPVKDDGTLGEGKVLHDATADVKASPDKGLPDGMKVDAKGNIFATAVNGIYVFDPHGKMIGRIVTNDKTANCAFGDDGSTLYMATNDKVTRVKTTTKGLGF